MARESQLIYAPLANRLGIWHVKWELEDLSFRYLEPETYKRIAKMLDEKRSEREGFIAAAVARLQSEMAPRRPRRDPWPAEAHLQHLEQDARQGHRLCRGV
jgi:GTP pyrophosphokinase